MTSKIPLLLTLLTYSIIVSQSFMYILALKDVQLSLDANAYTELRKLIDFSMRSNFKYVIYGALFANLALVISNIRNPGSLVFIAAAVAFVALTIDTLLTVKGNLPINDAINSWSADKYPADWTDYRDRWFAIFRYRQIANITGFVSLLVGAVFGTK